MTGQARNDRLYDGMCDECFQDAREIGDCGLRVAEHQFMSRPEPSSPAAIEKLGPNCVADTRCPDLPRCALCPGSPSYWRRPSTVEGGEAA